MPRLHRTVLSILAALVLVGCGDGDILAPGPDTGPLTALIQGQLFIADSATVTRTGYDVSVSAFGPDQRSIHFQFTDGGPRNYLIGTGNPVSASVTIGASSWAASASTGGGTISVRLLTATRIEGDLTLTVVGNATPASLEVTKGRFVIDFF